MSDYFDALMHSSGLAQSSRPSDSAPAAAADRGEDIVQSDFVRAVDGDPSASPLAPVSAPVETPELSARSAANVTSPAEPQSRAARTTPVAEAARPLTAHVKPAPPSATPELLSTTFAPAATAKTADEHGGAVVRAALEWVAADPQNASKPPARSQAAGEPPPWRPAPAGPSPREEQHALVVAEKAEVTMARTASPVAGAPYAHVSANHSNAPSRPATHAVAATMVEDVVEVSIGAINIRVDAATPPPAARIAPASAPPAHSRPPSERMTASSSLARRALRRI